MVHLLLFVTSHVRTDPILRLVRPHVLKFGSSALQVKETVSTHDLHTALTQIGTPLSAVRT